MTGIARILLVTLFAFAPVLITGCGGDKTKGTNDGLPTQSDGINDLKALLESCKAANKRPPASKNEIVQQYDATNPVASSQVARGLIIYFYGQGLTGGQSVIAHDAQCETAGGVVLLQDGTIKTMTADEFKAAPKAKK